MKGVLYLFIAISLVAFGIGIYQFVKDLSIYNSSEHRLMLHGDVIGFGDAAEDPRTENIRSQFSQQITKYKAKLEKQEMYALIIGFLVTGLSAFSTLISSLKAKTNNEEGSIKALKLVAVLTFISTLAGWGNTQINEAKSDTTRKLQTIKDVKTEFYGLYQKTEEGKKSSLIAFYTEKLADNK